MKNKTIVAKNKNLHLNLVLNVWNHGMDLIKINVILWQSAYTSRLQLHSFFILSRLAFVFVFIYTLLRLLKVKIHLLFS